MCAASEWSYLGSWCASSTLTRVHLYSELILMHCYQQVPLFVKPNFEAKLSHLDYRTSQLVINQNRPFTLAQGTLRRSRCYSRGQMTSKTRFRIRQGCQSSRCSLLEAPMTWKEAWGFYLSSYASHFRETYWEFFDLSILHISYLKLSLCNLRLCHSNFFAQDYLQYLTLDAD